MRAIVTKNGLKGLESDLPKDLPPYLLPIRKYGQYFIPAAEVEELLIHHCEFATIKGKVLQFGSTVNIEPIEEPKKPEVEQGFDDNRQNQVYWEAMNGYELELQKYNQSEGKKWRIV